jgi:tetratricopeptide (TPR) repeat protein
MPDPHLWITGARRADCAAAAARHQPDAAGDCDYRLRGPYTGVGTILRALVPGVHAAVPELTRAHAIEILAAAPELTDLIGPAPETLTSMASPEERTRWYSRYRTRRIAHGLVDFLRSCAASGPLTLAFGSAGQADHTDAEFLSIALRRLDPGQVRLIIAAGPDGPADDALRDALATWCRRESAPASAVPAASSSAVPAASSSAVPATPGDAAAFVASDGTSDVPGERAAYLAADPEIRARLHDQRAADLTARGEFSLTLGAIPYHLEHGSDPAAARAACQAAIAYCLGMAFYHVGLEHTHLLCSLIDADAEPEESITAWAYVCQALALLDRAAETEQIYYDLLSRTDRPDRHMNFSYALAILYTRLHGPERQDHRRALAHVNTAVAIASQFSDPDWRAFHHVFMNNGKALVLTHLGQPQEALRLVNDGIARLDRDLAPDRHRLHRSVLSYNRAQTLAALGRPEEALADYAGVLADDPNYPEYHFDRGNLLARLGRHAEALSDYAAAIRVTPPFPELYYNRGDALAAAGDPAGAMADFRYVLDLEPDYVEARLSLAALLVEAGDPVAAAEQARAGLALTPGEPRLHCSLGLALVETGANAAAREAFTQALRLHPGMPEALVNRAVAAYEDSQFEAAAADLSAALTDDPANPHLLHNRGLAYEAAGRPDDAIADYTAALGDSRADQAGLLFRRAAALAAAARPDEARADLSACLALGTSDHDQEIRDLMAATVR